MNVSIWIVVVSLILVAGYLLAQTKAGSALEKVYRDPAKLVELVERKTEPFILVDVRTAEEYSSGHIPGALNIPVDSIGRNYPTQDKDALIILYCRSGNRSGAAKQILEQAGFKRLVNFGGVNRWPKDLVTGKNPR
ncbi:MAG: rhodanese-like domain-containing protein [Spirochaetales bacterium]